LLATFINGPWIVKKIAAAVNKDQRFPLSEVKMRIGNPINLPKI